MQSITIDEDYNIIATFHHIDGIALFIHYKYNNCPSSCRI